MVAEGGKIWRLATYDAGRTERFAEAAGLSPVVARLLLTRGVSSPDVARSFLAPKMTDLRDPELLPGLGAAVERILAAIDAGERIIVYGDYDADGMCATAIVVRGLKVLGADVRSHVPNRLTDGYGLEAETLVKFAAQGFRLAISVDCGITAVEAVRAAKAAGLDLVVTDHHELCDELPEAVACVHPRLPGSTYPFGGLCGSGVAFKLVWGLFKAKTGERILPPRMRTELLTATVLAGLASVTDMVPLVDENRILVRAACGLFREYAPLGLKRLASEAPIEETKTITGDDFAFSIGPRINAAGRLGQAVLGVELLITDQPDRAGDLAKFLVELNRQRDTLERRVYRGALDQIKQRFPVETSAAFVLADPTWHAGVVGIVANRLVEKFNRAVVLVALDPMASQPGLGSARGVPGIALHEALAACTEHLVTHGGHEKAAGLRVEESRLDRFRDEFCDYVAGHWREEDRIPRLDIAAEATFSQLTRETVRQIEQLSPFGEGNPRPTFCSTGVRLAAPPRTIGSGDRHLALQLEQHGIRLRAIGFGKADWAEPLDAVGGPFDVAYRPVINEFRGQANVELHLVDWRPPGSATGSRPTPD